MNRIIRHNLLIAPLVIFVRVPILLPLLMLVKLGEAAERAGDWIGSVLPGFKR